MHVVVFGGTGRTGHHILKSLAKAGHEITLYGRRAPAEWTGRSVIGSPDDQDRIAETLNGADAVLSALGSTRAEPACLLATRSVIEASQPGLRYITVAGAAVDVPGDAKAVSDRIIGHIFRLLMGQMLAERQAEYQALLASSLAFTLLRPPMLTDQQGTGNWVATHDTPATKHITRADLAEAMVEMLERDDMIRRAPFVAARPR